MFVGKVKAGVVAGPTVASLIFVPVGFETKLLGIVVAAANIAATSVVLFPYKVLVDKNLKLSFFIMSSCLF